MNIFFLHPHPVRAAEFHCDKHVVKMIVETAQILSTAHRVLDGTLTYELKPVVDKNTGLPKHKDGRPVARKVKRWNVTNARMQKQLYKATHVNHPSTVWARSNSEAYLWTYELFVALLNEHAYRYKKSKLHKCNSLREILKQLPANIKRTTGQFSYPPIAIKNKSLHHSDVVTAYRNYYNVEKVRFAKWTVRKQPWWWNPNHLVSDHVSLSNDKPLQLVTKVRPLQSVTM